MNSRTDQQLLRDYTECRSEAAFGELVRRHVDLVYSAALRMVCDAQLAEDVTQGVFVALAQNARHLTDRSVLSGWLHRTAQNLAANAVRSDVRRRVREQEAAAMNELLSAETDASWEQIASHLDAALGELSEPDRDALLLRYFEHKSAHEMAQTLGVSDEAAQKRVSRAVERLREFFAKRGVTVGTGGLIVLITANAVQAAPVGLAVTISTAAALAGTILTTSSTGFGATVINLIVSTKLKAVGVVAAVAMGTGAYVFQERATAAVRNDNRALRAQIAPLAGTRAEDERLARWNAERQLQMEAQRQRDELLRLRGQVADLRNQLAEQRRTAMTVNIASINGAPLDVPGTSFRLAEAKDVGTRTPMALLQTRYWAGHTANAERFRELFVEAPGVSEREKKRGQMFMERMFKMLSGDSGVRNLDNYQEARLLQEIPSEDGTEIQLVAQVRGRAGWQRLDANLRRVGDEWRFVKLMSPHELTPSIPE